MLLVLAAWQYLMEWLLTRVYSLAICLSAGFLSVISPSCPCTVYAYVCLHILGGRGEGGGGVDVILESLNRSV